MRSVALKNVNNGGNQKSFVQRELTLVDEVLAAEEAYSPVDKLVGAMSHYYWLREFRQAEIANSSDKSAEASQQLIEEQRSKVLAMIHEAKLSGRELRVTASINVSLI